MEEPHVLYGNSHGCISRTGYSIDPMSPFKSIEAVTTDYCADFGNSQKLVLTTSTFKNFD